VIRQAFLLAGLSLLFPALAIAAAETCNPVGACFDQHGRQTARKPLAFSGQTNEELVRRYESMLSKCGCQEFTQAERLDCVRGTNGIVELGTGILHLAAVYRKAPASLLAKAEAANTVSIGAATTGELKAVMGRKKELSCRGARFNGISDRLERLYVASQQKAQRAPASADRQRCFFVMAREVSGFKSFVSKDCGAPCAGAAPKQCAKAR